MLNAVAGRRVRLPRVGAGRKADLWRSLRRRRSVREYSDTPLPLASLSRLAWAAGGENGRTEHDLAFRTAPSAGALYPINTYIVCRDVDGVEAGVYRYDPGPHALDLVRPGDLSRELAAAALGQGFVARAAVVFVWTAVVARCTAKYAARGYRYMYMEAGITSENLALAAEALSLGSCAVGAFCDDAVDALLGTDGRDEIALLLQPVGATASGR